MNIQYIYRYTFFIKAQSVADQPKPSSAKHN